MVQTIERLSDACKDDCTLVKDFNFEICNFKCRNRKFPDMFYLNLEQRVKQVCLSTACLDHNCGAN